MTENVLQVGPQIFAVIAGLIVFLAAALAFSFKSHTRVEAGRRGHAEGDTDENQKVSPTGLIMTFAGKIEEAGGSIPYMAAAIIIVTLVCYFGYLFIYWNPR